MMNRRLMACTAGALLSAAFVYADGPKNAQLQPYTGPIQYVQPLRVCKVRLVNGQIVQAGPWMDYSQFAPTSNFPPSPCAAGGDLAFDNFEFAPGGLTPGENPKYGSSCGLGGSRWWFGPSYRNPLWVNDMRVVAGTGGRRATGVAPCWANTNTNNANRFIMAIFTADNFDATCQGPPAGGIYDGVAYDFGNLPTGAWYSLICLDGTGLFHQIPPDGQGAYIGFYLSSLNPPTLYPEPCQPLLWGTKVNNPSFQGPIQWDDDDPTNGQFTAPNECYDYTYNVCPNPLGAMMAFWVERPTCRPCPDVNRDNTVNDADLLIVLANFGSSGNPGIPGDANCDGQVNDADLLSVLANFGGGGC